MRDAALPLDTFIVECVVPCVNSWGDEDAYVHVCRDVEAGLS